MFAPGDDDIGNQSGSCPERPPGWGFRLPFTATGPGPNPPAAAAAESIVIGALDPARFNTPQDEVSN